MSILSSSSTQRILAVAVLLVTSALMYVATTTDAYTTSNDLRRARVTPHRKIWNMPLPTTTISTSNPSPSMIDNKKTSSSSAQSMLKRSSLSSHEQRHNRGSGSGGWQLSQAAINTDAGFDDASPSRSRTTTVAHGILSPETVRRMDEITLGGRGNEAVKMFLQSYRQRGPMSCLEMLSDPDVLPHLTQAMRDIV